MSNEPDDAPDAMLDMEFEDRISGDMGSDGDMEDEREPELGEE